MAKKVFIDTNPLIYLVGKHEPYYSKVLKFISQCIAENASFYTSTITDAEFLVLPLSQNDSKQINQYKSFIKNLAFEKCKISEGIAEKAALIRANHKNIKLPDALQLASSMECGCDVFLTNDKQLNQIVEANVVLLGDL